eukprot:Clim_evm69s156 gene=Clim_evmTU69s156
MGMHPQKQRALNGRKFAQRQTHAHSGHQKGKSTKYRFNAKSDALERPDITQQVSEPDFLDRQEDTTKFSQLPLSSRTQAGLRDAGYTTMTSVQCKSVGRALTGRNVLGAAKTGSGKTLAFVIPMLERLWHEKWSRLDGLGALIVTPTRELAYQIYEVLRTVGKYHEFSAALVIGGKDLREEENRLRQTNILICTPGRLLQHLDETAAVSTDNLQLFILDEADMIMSMGFQKTMDAIIDHVPKTVQTLLFSATQTKSVNDMVRLRLKDPDYVAVHENDATTTPDKLLQTYVVCDAPIKMNVLFSFLRTHTKAKILIFMSSCKQVRYVFEALRKLRPGIPLMHLHGKQKQNTRVAIYDEFTRKNHAALFATDIAARGLDFPEVHWVVQMDCPDNVETYIHRVGRTARFHKDGRALLMLTSSEEEAFVEELNKKKIPINEIEINPTKTQDITDKLAGLCSADPELKYLAQKAVVSYTRSIYLQKRKDIFSLDDLDVDDLARSYGLLNPPKIKFAKKVKKIVGDTRGNVSATKSKKMSNEEAMLKRLEKTAFGSDGEEEDEHEDEGVKTKELKRKTKLDKMFDRKNNTILSGARQAMQDEILKSGMSAFDAGAGNSDDDDEEEDVLMPKSGRQQHHDFDDDDDDLPVPDRKTIKSKTVLAQAKKAARKGIKMNTKIVFDEDTGEVKEVQGPVADDGDAKGLDLRKAAAEMRLRDQEDRLRERERVKEKHREKRLKERKKRKEDGGGEGPIARLASIADESDEDDGPLSDGINYDDLSSDDDDGAAVYDPTKHGSPRKKRARKSGDDTSVKKRVRAADDDLATAEEMALAMLEE